MPTLVYSPGVRAYISTRDNRTVDVTADIISGSIHRIENGVSSATLTLANRNRMYDGVFTPNDRIVIELRRLRWVPVFTGYLNKVPLVSAWPSSIQLTASCSLKRLQYYLWDAFANASVELLNAVETSGQRDGGLRLKAEKVLTDVVGWSPSKIHIGEVPSSWLDEINSLYDIVAGSLDPGSVNYDIAASQGSSAVIGAAPSSVNIPFQGLSSVPGLAGNQATGLLPATSGTTVSIGSGEMLLTGADWATASQTSEWACAMRWPFWIAENESPTTLSPEQVDAAKSWWKDRKIWVYSPQSNLSVVLRAADWGPRADQNAVIGMTPRAQKALAGTGSVGTVSIAFAPEDAPLGIYTGRSSVSSSNDALFPVPVSAYNGVRNFAWGNFQNGNIPLDRLSPVDNQYLHPIAAQAFVMMQQAAAADNVTIRIATGQDSTTTGYRSLATQRRLFNAYKSGTGPLAAEPGTSKHGWGLAADIEVGGRTNFSGARYRWLKENAHRFGWVNPEWAQEGQSGAEAWHWEFWGIFGFSAAQRASERAVTQERISDSVLRLEAEARERSTQTVDPMFGEAAENLFNFELYRQQPSKESAILGGAKILMNDQPVMSSIKTLVGAAMRSFSSAPNGDFIAWFPDYFGMYGTAGILRMEPIEVTDFSVDWSDAELKTHMFVMGSEYPTASLSGGPVGTYAKFLSHGVASIDFPEIIRALFNIDPQGTDQSSASRILSDPNEILRRFGPRVEQREVPIAIGRKAEFWHALYLFQQNWTDQFSTTMTTTFMPEAYPGMLLQIPELELPNGAKGFQAYIREVRHSFDFTTGFRTSITITAPAALDEKGLYGLPKAGPRYLQEQEARRSEEDR